MQKKALRFSTHFGACSTDAGNYLFGSKRFQVVRNAIELKRFGFNPTMRENNRQSYNVCDKFVIGSIGRFVNQKNPLFVLEIFKKIKLSMNNASLFMIGEGELEGQMKLYIDENNLTEDVIILKPSNHVERYYNLFDTFLLPSKYEGLGIVLIEAQVAGLDVYTSDVVPSETRITDNIKYLSLDHPAEYWANEIVRNLGEMGTRGRVDDPRIIAYGIDEQVKLLESYYTSAYEGQGEYE